MIFVFVFVIIVHLCVDIGDFCFFVFVIIFHLCVDIGDYRTSAVGVHLIVAVHGIIRGSLLEPLTWNLSLRFDSELKSSHLKFYVMSE